MEQKKLPKLRINWKKRCKLLEEKLKRERKHQTEATDAMLARQSDLNGQLTFKENLIAKTEENYQRAMREMSDLDVQLDMERDTHLETSKTLETLRLLHEVTTLELEMADQRVTQLIDVLSAITIGGDYARSMQQREDTEAKPTGGENLEKDLKPNKFSAGKIGSERGGPFRPIIH